MSRQSHKQIGTKHGSRVDHLLSLLNVLSRQSPSPAIRERLATLAAERLGQESAISSRTTGHAPREMVQLRLGFAAALVIGAGIATLFAVRSGRHQPAVSGN